MNRRVAITGMGLITPLGIGREAFAAALMDGACAIRTIAGFDTGGRRSHLGAEVTDFDPMDFIDARSGRRMDRLSRMVTAAARMAVDDAGIDLDNIDRDRAGIVMGTAFGATDVAARFGGTLFTEGPRRVNPILVPNTVMNAPAGHAAIALGLRGVNTTVNHREASAETAIAFAADQIRQGRADMLLTGGGDLLAPFFFTVLDRFGALSPRTGGAEGARPFDRHRNGPVAGEGVGLLCLEAMDAARRRQAPIIAEIVGWGLSGAPSPANDWPEDPAAMVSAMERAMTMAGLRPSDIDAVFAAASGGIRSDRLEARAIGQLFPGRRQPAITAVKGALGENFASGGIRTAALALSIHGSRVPPTVGLAEPMAGIHGARPECREMDLTWGLVNACASGGTFASLVLRKAP